MPTYLTRQRLMRILGAVALMTCAGLALRPYVQERGICGTYQIGTRQLSGKWRDAASMAPYEMRNRSDCSTIARVDR